MNGRRETVLKRKECLAHTEPHVVTRKFQSRTFHNGQPKCNMIWMKLGNSSVCFEPFQRVLHQTLFTQCVLQLPSGRLTPPYSPGVRCWRISVQVTSRLATSLAVKKTDSTANSNIFFLSFIHQIARIVEGLKSTAYSD